MAWYTTYGYAHIRLSTDDYKVVHVVLAEIWGHKAIPSPTKSDWTLQRLVDKCRRLTRNVTEITYMRFRHYYYPPGETHEHVAYIHALGEYVDIGRELSAI